MSSTMVTFSSIRKLKATSLESDYQCYFSEFTKDVKEELLMIPSPTADFIGSIGGSLGLFLEFSWFTYVSGMLDKLLS